MYQTTRYILTSTTFLGELSLMMLAQIYYSMLVWFYLHFQTENMQVFIGSSASNELDLKSKNSTDRLHFAGSIAQVIREYILVNFIPYALRNLNL